MYDYSYDYESKCNAILKWSRDQPNFNAYVVESILDWMYDHDLSSSQEQAIDNIIDGFKIKVEDFL